MEGSYWLRFGLIVAMVLGCVYVLSPTVLVESDIDATDYAEGSADAVMPIDEAWFDADDGTADPEVVDPVRARLDAYGLAHERVEAQADGLPERLVVHLTVGTRPEDVAELVTVDGAAGVVPVAQVSGYDPAALEAAEEADAVLVQQILDGGLAADATPLPLELAAAMDDEGRVTLTLTGEALPEAGTPLVITLEGEPVGFVRAAGDGQPTPMVALDDRADPRRDAAMLVSGPLGEAFGVHEAVESTPEAAADALEDTTVVEEVAWYEPLLPETKLNLGLDLQGGIDLTLQVDLEEAVLAQVRRDRNMLRDQAVQDGVDLQTSLDRTRPAIKMGYAGDFAELRTYLSDSLGDYDYVETYEEDGGTVHVFRIGAEREETIRTSAVSQVLETLRKRVDSTGVKEPSIVQMPGGRINIQLPGVENAQQAIDAIGTQAILEFRLVDMDADELTLQRAITEAEQTLRPEEFALDDLLDEWLHREGVLAEEQHLFWFYEESEPGVLERTRPIVLKGDALLSGSDISDARVGFQQTDGQPVVSMAFKRRGASVFCDVTTNNVRKQFAIILDDQVRSAPRINEPICGGAAQIEMGGNAEAIDEANTLALVLRTGSLTAPVDIGQVSEIGPSLGADAIRSGVIGSMVGGSITLLFMALWYRKPGLIADVALVMNVLLVFALLAMFGATLTLPGIAGVALTIGMAVDANIIVYERIREELALGVKPRKAVDVGYSKGVVAVLDANITTAIAGVVLYSYGTGPIKGFAVTLLIGIFTTLVTALFVTRTFMEMLTRNSNARLRI